MTKEEVADQVMGEQPFFRGLCPERAMVKDLIVEAITRYIRATVPEGPVNRESVEMAFSWISSGAVVNRNLGLLITHFDHLERTIVMMMDEGNVYEQGKLAERNRYQQERMELLSLLRILEFIGGSTGFNCCPLCFGINTKSNGTGHKDDCRLAKAIGSKTESQY